MRSTVLFLLTWRHHVIKRYMMLPNTGILIDLISTINSAYLHSTAGLKRNGLWRTMRLIWLTLWLRSMMAFLNAMVTACCSHGMASPVKWAFTRIHGMRAFQSTGNGMFNRSGNSDYDKEALSVPSMLSQKNWTQPSLRMLFPLTEHGFLFPGITRFIQCNSHHGNN